MQVYVASLLEPTTETAYDLGALDQAAGIVVGMLDYSDLETALPELDGRSATAEAEAGVLWQRLENSLGDALSEVVLHETPHRRCLVKKR